ncbi:MAG: SDR family oxidoreductase [Candidatus Izemoplasmatales bacterium]
MGRFLDKVVIVTGGGKGIGREIARAFALEGAHVVITGRTETDLATVRDRIREERGACDYLVGDVTVPADCERIVGEVYLSHRHIDALVNNAGASMRGLFAETDLSLFRKIVDVNFLGAVNMTKYALPSLLESKGSVVFVSSLSALRGIPGIAPYGAAKMALTGFGESLQAELHDAGVHVGIVYVGFTENDANKRIYDARGNLVPLQREKNDDTQEGVARSVLKAVAKRKRVMVLTAAGKFVDVFYRLFPRLSGYLMRTFAVKGFVKR